MASTVQEVVRGDTWEKSWLVRYKSTGADVVLAGGTGNVYLRHIKTRKVMLIADTDNGLTLSDGRIDLNVDYTIMDTVPAGEYQYDVEVTVDGKRKTYVHNARVDILQDNNIANG